MSAPTETGVLLQVHFPTRVDGSGVVAPIEFGAVTVDPKSFAFAGTFQRTDASGRKVHLVKVSQPHLGTQVAFCGVGEVAAIELVKLLRYVLEGRISRPTYRIELTLWNKPEEQKSKLNGK